MKAVRLGIGAAIVVGLGACQVTVGSGGGSGAANPGSAPPPHPVAQAQSHPAPAPAPAPGPAPAPAQAPAPQHAMSAHVGGGNPMVQHKIALSHRLNVRKTPPPTLRYVQSVKLDPGAIAKIRQRPHTSCGPHEMAPNVFVTLDCVKRYQPVSKAKLVSAAKFLTLYKQGKLHVDQGIGGGAPKDHPVGDGTPTELPASVDHRVDGTEGPVKDQGLVGSCTAFSLSTVVDNAVRRLNKTDVVSSMHVWSHYGVPSMRDAGDANFGKPLAVWDDYPYDQKTACGMYSGDSEFSCADEFSPKVPSGGVAFNDPKVKADIANADAKGRYKVSGIDNIFHEGMDPDELAAQLASGKDIWVAFKIDDDAWGFRSVKNGVIPDWTNEGGGHAVVLSGYRTSGGGKQFLIHNSWTKDWGDQGYAWVSEAMVKRWLHAAYVVKVDDVTAAPPPAPPAPNPDGRCPAGYTSDGAGPCMKTCAAQGDCDSSSTCAAVATSGAGGTTSGPQACVPNNPLTDDDCADDELVDSVTGRCMTMCADGSRPANGQCNAGTGGAHPPRK